MVAKDFDVGFDDDFLLSDEISGPAIAYSPCGEEVIFRINSSIRAHKSDPESSEEVEIAIDTTDIAVTGMSRPFVKAYLKARPC